MVTDSPARQTKLAPIGSKRDALQVMPRWFPYAALGLTALGFLGVAPGLLLVIAAGLALITCRDTWQVLLVVLLVSLTVATARSGVLGFEFPFLLRFVVVSILLALTLLNHGFRRGAPGRTGLVQTVLLLFFIAASVRSFDSVSLTDSVQGYLAAAVTLAVPLVAATSRWRDRETLRGDLALSYRYLLLIITVGLGIAAAAGFSGRASGIHANPNTYAFMCVLAFGLDLGLRSFVTPRVRLLITPALVLGVVASGSRGALLGVLLATIFLLLRRDSRSRGRRVALILLTGGAILLAFPVAGPLDVRAVYERTFGGEELDLSGREVGWENMLSLWADRPFFGHGLRVTDTLLRDRFAIGAFDSRLGSHSGYLTVLVESGSIGAFLLFSAVFVALRGRPRLSEDEPLWMAASGVIVAGLGHMTVESFVLGVGSPFPIVFWSAVAIAALLSTTRRQQTSAQRRLLPR